MANHYATDNGRYRIVCDDTGNVIFGVGPMEKSKRVTLRTDDRVQCRVDPGKCKRLVPKSSANKQDVHLKHVFNRDTFVCPEAGCDFSERNIIHMIHHLEGDHGKDTELYWAHGFSHDEADMYMKLICGQYTSRAATTLSPLGRERRACVYECISRSTARNGGCSMFVMIQRLALGVYGVLSNGQHSAGCGSTPTPILPVPTRTRRRDRLSESDDDYYPDHTYSARSTTTPRPRKRAHDNGQGTSTVTDNQVENSSTSPPQTNAAPQVTRLLPVDGTDSMEVKKEPAVPVEMTQVVAPTANSNVVATAPANTTVPLIGVCLANECTKRRIESGQKIVKYVEEEADIAKENLVKSTSVLCLTPRESDEQAAIAKSTEARQTVDQEIINSAKAIKIAIDNHKKLVENGKQLATKEQQAIEKHRKTNLLLQSDIRARDNCAKMLADCKKKIADERAEFKMWQDEENKNM